MYIHNMSSVVKQQVSNTYQGNASNEFKINIDHLKKKMEIEGGKYAEKCIKSEVPLSSIGTFLENKSKQFKEATGRNMTYSEMREMFG